MALAYVALKQWDEGWRPVRLIKYRENAVFEVSNAAGQKAALRVHRPGYHSDVELRSELLWMAALSDGGIALPRPIPARSGALLTVAEADGIPSPRRTDLFEWVDGLAISKVTEVHRLPEIYRQIGALAAAIHRHAAGWQPPADFCRHAWNADGLIGPRALWGDYRELQALTVQDRHLLDHASKLAIEELARLPATEYIMIHADLVPDNLILCADGVKAIDFDDAGFGWRMFEIATALFAYLGQPNYADIEHALLEGYHSVFPLSERERATLPLFFFLRGLTYLSWVHTRSGTQTAREMTLAFIDRTRILAQDYLN